MRGLVVGMFGGSVPVVDADAHVLEPPDLWERYLEPGLRDRAIRIVDDGGMELLVVDDQPVERLRGVLGALGGSGKNAADATTPGRMTWVDGFAPGSTEGGERLTILDEEGIDLAFFYPTLGIVWEGFLKDPALATPYARAYNRWLVDFCSADRKRLFPVAHVSLMDEVGACEEMRRAHADGCIGVMLSPDPMSRLGRPLDHEDFTPFWNTAQELGIPVAFHVVVRNLQDRIIRDWLHPTGPQELELVFLGLDVMAAFTQMMTAGVFERFPGLKVAVLESGATWIGAWLDRMDAKWSHSIYETSLKMKPSEYFFRQCVVSADPDETMIADMVRHLGAEYFVWASDYPHLDASLGVLKELRDNISSLSEADQAEVLGGAAMRFYNLT